MRLGILGGTFDPIHVGHLAAARVAMDCAALDRVLFVPSNRPPHREVAIADPDQRLEMCRLAVAGEPRFEVSDVEIKRGGTSYTADTVRSLHNDHPKDDLSLILGWDAARLFATWHEPQAIRSLASVIVVRRPGTQTPDVAQLRDAGLDPSRTVLCVGNTPDISASELRHSLSVGESTGDCLPSEVEAYIRKNRIYRDNRHVG